MLALWKEESLSDDVLLDTCCDLVGNGLACPHSISDVPGRNPYQRNLDHGDPATRRGQDGEQLIKIDIDPGSRSDSDLRKLKNELRGTPGREILQRILTHQENKFVIGELPGEKRQRLLCIGGSCALHIDQVNRERRTSPDGDLQHPKAIVDRSKRQVGFVWRVTGRNKQHVIEPKSVAEFRRHDEMANVNGVERSPEYSKSPPHEGDTPPTVRFAWYAKPGGFGLHLGIVRRD